LSRASAPDSRHTMADQPRIPATFPERAQRSFPVQGEPLIHSVNWIGLGTLYMKEVRRFFKVQVQTIWAPAATTLLQLVIFTLALGGAGRMVLGVPFATFVAPGLIVMAMMQNAFQNGSFSFLSGKMQGTIVDFLMPPLSEAELMLAMIGAALTRAVLVGAALAVFMLFWPQIDLTMAQPWAVIWFGLMGSVFLAMVGMLSSIWAEKFDHNAAITNFFVTPMTMLSGTFYAVDRLSPMFRAISHANPFFYVISGFRYGFIGASDISGGSAAVVQGAIGLGLFNLALILLTYFVLKSGWRLKS